MPPRNISTSPYSPAVSLIGLILAAPLILVLGLVRISKVPRLRAVVLIVGLGLALVPAAQARWVARTVWMWRAERPHYVYAAPRPHMMTRREMLTEACRIDAGQGQPLSWLRMRRDAIACALRYGGSVPR